MASASLLLKPYSLKPTLHNVACTSANQKTKTVSPSLIQLAYKLNKITKTISALKNFSKTHVRKNPCRTIKKKNQKMILDSSDYHHRSVLSIALYNGSVLFIITVSKHCFYLQLHCNYKYCNCSRKLSS